MTLREVSREEQFVLWCFQALVTGQYSDVEDLLVHSPPSVLRLLLAKQHFLQELIRIHTMMQLG